MALFLDSRARTGVRCNSEIDILLLTHIQGVYNVFCHDDKL